jgi:HK97 family phage prohead protease
MLEKFKRNPVITWAHDDRGYTASGGRPIAKALPETVRVEDGKLKMRLQFPKPGVFKFADEVFGLLADGFLNAVSVGFDPIKTEEIDGPEGEEFWFRRQELMEVAVVTIPSNSDALAERAKRMNASVEEVRARVEGVEKLAQETIDPEEFGKYKRYYETKQPANKAATKVLKAFFKARNEEQPDDEVEAWQRMEEIIEEEATDENPDESAETPEEPETPEEQPEEPETPVVEETEPAPTPSAEEAPQPERKASVQIPLQDLRELPKRFVEALDAATTEALKRGVGTRALGALVKDLAEKHLAAR